MYFLVVFFFWCDVYCLGWVGFNVSVVVVVEVWNLFVFLNVFFGEVVIGVIFYLFFFFWGIFVIFFLYGFYVFVFVFIVYCFGRLCFEILYLVGVIFGFYEVYIIKIIWNLDWEFLI